MTSVYVHALPTSVEPDPDALAVHCAPVCHHEAIHSVDMTTNLVRRKYLAAGLLTTAALLAGTVVGSGSPAAASPAAGRHVLLISVDGMHQADLARYVATHPNSALAALVRGGTSWTQAQTTFPSDSFPGMVAQVTGGSPKTTGVYYDVTYNPTLLPPGTVDCATAKPGTTVAYDESIDRDSSRLDAGQGLAGLPRSILSMTPTPTSLIDPAALPVEPAICRPVYPNDYLKVNTVFEVAHAHGLRTAWSDKHPAYQILGGPSGAGIDDLFTPEINSNADRTGDDWTSVNALTQRYDGFKVSAVLNEIAGRDHSGTRVVGVPAIMGLNFQSVSTAEKLPTSGGEPGGYLADGRTPGPVLSSALDFVDQSLGRLEQALAARGLSSSTTVILSAKHGQSPTDPGALTRIDDGTLLAGLDAAWEAAGHTGPLVAGSSDDDGMLLWLTDRSAAATAFARSYLLAQQGDGTGAGGTAKATSITGAPKPYTRSGLRTVYAGADAAHFIGVAAGDSRVPDVIGIAAHGTVFTGGTKKIAEHGGDDPQDRNVPLVVDGPIAHRGVITDQPVLTTQIAPTILRAIGLAPGELTAVRTEGTPLLPGLV